MIVKCPHCNDYVEILDINCGIFRHAVYKTGEQVPPHLSKDKCEELLKTNKIFGCCGPFQICKENDVWVVKICDYI